MSNAVRLTIPGWLPVPLNSLMKGWRKGAKLKARDRQRIAVYARFQGLKPAVGKRRVGLILTFGKGVRSCDVDAYWKSTLDALKHAKLIVNDTHKWVELTTPIYIRSKGFLSSTAIILEDI